MIVYTETSKYVIDHDTCTLTRYDGHGDGPANDVVVRVASLRYDREPIRLLGMSRPTVGEPMALVVTGLADQGVHTIRLTTLVTRVIMSGAEGHAVNSTGE